MNGKQCYDANKNNMCRIFCCVQFSALMMTYPLVAHNNLLVVQNISVH